MNKRHRVGEHVLAIRLPTPPTFYCVRYSYGKGAEDYPVVHYLGAFMFQLLLVNMRAITGCYWRKNI